MQQWVQGDRQLSELQQVGRYRFGVFEANAATGELRKQGIRIKLHVQPFQMLVMLLEHPGKVLTREEIAARLWPTGTFVDYEHGLNSAMNRIREALGDKARNPRFVETLARRGYRFVAPVQRLDGEVSLEGTEEIISFLATPDELPKSPRRTVRALFVLLQLMYLGYYVGALANLPEITDLFAVLDHPTGTLDLLIMTATLLIPVRIFLACAVIFYAPGIRRKYLRLWPFLLPFDVLWALSPFLLLHHINAGLALACVAPLVYSPFAQRSLMLMGAGERPTA